jgi:hypothetical protein
MNGIGIIGGGISGLQLALYGLSVRNVSPAATRGTA